MSPHIIPPDEPIFRIGLGGNYYVYCKWQIPVMTIAKKIGKSMNAVYFHKEYKVWAIRVRSKKHKEALKSLFKPL
jgi:hypothetical protein